MMRTLSMLFLLATLGFASFIRSPIPPSAFGHFISDKDNDGRADCLTISFLKPVSENYIKEYIDSLVLEFPDSSFKNVRLVAKSLDLKIDAENSNRMYFDFSKKKMALGVSALEEKTNISATLFQRSAASVELVLQDSLAPVPLKVFLSKGTSLREDTLKILFSEPIESNVSVTEFSLRSGKDSEIRQIPCRVKNTLDSSLALHLILPSGSFEYFSPSDSVLLEENLVKDYEGNVSKRRWVSLSGLSPFRLLTLSQASYSPQEVRERPVFELEFKETGTPFPKNRLGISLDMGEEQFVQRVLELLQKRNKAKTALLNDEISVVLEMNIFSHSGNYLTGSQAEIKGNDERLQKGRRVFFFWNFMDGRRRYVGSGAYFVRIGLKVLYQGKMIYQDYSADFNSWGVLRRD